MNLGHMREISRDPEILGFGKFKLARKVSGFVSGYFPYFVSDRPAIVLIQASKSLENSGILHKFINKTLKIQIFSENCKFIGGDLLNFRLFVQQVD